MVRKKKNLLTREEEENPIDKKKNLLTIKKERERETALTRRERDKNTDEETKDHTDTQREKNLVTQR